MSDGNEMMEKFLALTAEQRDEFLSALYLWSMIQLPDEGFIVLPRSVYIDDIERAARR